MEIRVEEVEVVGGVDSLVDCHCAHTVGLVGEREVGDRLECFSEVEVAVRDRVSGVNEGERGAHGWGLEVAIDLDGVGLVEVDSKVGGKLGCWVEAARREEGGLGGEGKEEKEEEGEARSHF